MDDIDDRAWLEQLDLITAWGEASAANQTPPPAAAELWAQARRHSGLRLPDRPDPVLLAQLRAAFTRGRFPAHIDLAALAAAVRARGHDATVAHTGGGVAVLYAGRRAPDRHGDLRWSAAVGPGRYPGRDTDFPIADPADCYLGPDDDDTWGIRVPPGWTLDLLTDLTTAVIAEVEADRARFTQAADAARDAMLAAFTAHYPHADPTPVAADDTFNRACTTLLAGWLDEHLPGDRRPPAHLAALAARTPTGPGDAAEPAGQR
ncbi:hypothetical protein [Dactylosporangium matsuzakiense]|uniref:Uncharacterized protein n=1 Tax=Dactylosporangium matsuzakiense TaxID=53360 RepID=A0A9W6KKF2_9ACTN|nr:hypothetical protein [Dactylosporangium matsuzakiense]GLL03722.1 hypothetical protein GCM10017581_054680 [Dactylosporangium matsuzakiense]